MSDLAILDELTVESILSHLKERYDGDQIYVSVYLQSSHPSLQPFAP
jgi:myosin heavy subunit